MRASIYACCNLSRAINHSSRRSDASILPLALAHLSLALNPLAAAFFRGTVLLSRCVFLSMYLGRGEIPSRTPARVAAGASIPVRGTAIPSDTWGRVRMFIHGLSFLLNSLFKYLHTILRLAEHGSCGPRTQTGLFTRAHNGLHTRAHISCTSPGISVGTLGFFFCDNSASVMAFARAT